MKYSINFNKPPVMGPETSSRAQVWLNGDGCEARIHYDNFPAVDACLLAVYTEVFWQSDGLRLHLFSVWGLQMVLKRCPNPPPLNSRDIILAKDNSSHSLRLEMLHQCVLGIDYSFTNLIAKDLMRKI